MSALEPRVLCRSRDGSSAIASSRGVAARYFALRHPVAARAVLRRMQRRASRLAALAKSELVKVVGTRRLPEAGAPWWVDAAANALCVDVTSWLCLVGPDGSDKSIGFLFEGTSRYPTAVAKIASSPHAAGRVERGYRALEHLRAAGIAARGLAPEPLALMPGPNGEIASFETPIPGAWLDTVLDRGTEAFYIEQVTDWLIDLAGLTYRSEAGGAWSSIVPEVVDRFSENVVGLVDPGFLAAARSMVAEVKRMPTVFEHHDCTPWNFYVTPRPSLVAFDWDNADSRGVPMFDLVQLHGQMAFSIDGSLGSRRFAESLRRRGVGKLAVVRAESRSRYASALTLDEGMARGIRVFAWMRPTSDELEARRRAGAPLRAEEIERSMLAAWIEEARSAMDR